MKQMILSLGLALVASASFGDINLPNGGSANINGQIVTCGGSSGGSYMKCDCNSVYGKIGEVVVSQGTSSIDECHKINASASPTNCGSLPNPTGTLVCDCNSVYGKIGEVIITQGLSPSDECHKVNASSSPYNCASR